MIVESSVTISFNLAETKDVESAYHFYEKVCDDNKWQFEKLTANIARFTKKETFEL